MLLRRFLTGCLGAAAVAAVGMIGWGCDFPYEPGEPPLGGIDDPPSAGRSLYGINGGIQICNESVSQNTTQFPGCMLWLNFEGLLPVTVPPQWEGIFTTSGVLRHDRLTVTDTSNTVTWFFMQPDYITAEFQDPEWSTHPDYIVFLGGEKTGSTKIWSGYVIRVNPNPLLPQQVFKFNDDKLNETSTPHVWLPDTVTSAAEASGTITYDETSGMADTASVAAFFGTRNFKVAFALKDKNNIHSLYYYDNTETTPQVHALNKGTEIAGWQCESPMISPDGQWVAYNAYQPNDITNYKACLQKLDPESYPVVMTAGTSSDPRWWRKGGDLYVVYSTRGGPIPIGEELTEEAADGSLGSTMLQRVRLTQTSGDIPQWFLFDGDPKTLVKLPFKGGLSPDGHFLSTGYVKAYLYYLK